MSIRFLKFSQRGMRSPKSNIPKWFLECHGMILTIFSHQKSQNDTRMKNMVYFFICNLILVALFVLSSCSSHENESHVQPRPSDVPAYRFMTADSSSQNKAQTKDVSSVRAKMSQKSTDDLIHWSDYSTLNGDWVFKRYYYSTNFTLSMLRGLASGLSNA